MNAGPIPHAHDAFDEAIYVLSGHLLVVGDDEPQQAAPGSMLWPPTQSVCAKSTPGTPAACCPDRCPARLAATEERT